LAVALAFLSVIPSGNLLLLLLLLLHLLLHLPLHLHLHLHLRLCVFRRHPEAQPKDPRIGLCRCLFLPLPVPRMSRGLQPPEQPNHQERALALARRQPSAWGETTPESQRKPPQKVSTTAATNDQSKNPSSNSSRHQPFLQNSNRNPAASIPEAPPREAFRRPRRTLEGARVEDAYLAAAGRSAAAGETTQLP
jgi:hypothetical protein